MRRAPLVIAATAAGLVGILSFHSTPARLTLGSLGTGPTAKTATTTTPTPTTSTAAGASPPTTAPVGPKTAVGQAVNYSWGVLAVQVTVTGSKLTNVSIASLDDGGNPRSQSIDQQSIPVLVQQAMQAQSANIQGVSGASYTSAGFAQSLQSALTKLGVK